MNPEKQTISAENLRQIRKSRGMNQTTVGEVIGLTAPQVSQIENGIRALSASEKALLDLFFFGVIPKGVAKATSDTRSVLEFTEDEWRVIEILAKRAGLTSEKWIASKIREYLTWSGEARQISADSYRGEKGAPEELPSSARASNQGDRILRMADEALRRRRKTQPSSDA